MVARMGTLAQDGEIRPSDVEREIGRSRTESLKEAAIAPAEAPSPQSSFSEEDPYLKSLLGSGYSARFDAIEIATLSYVLDICKTCTSAAEAGRRLYNITRDGRSVHNDSDRIAKFLKTFNLKFSMLQHA
jgi:transcriptional regulatory protein RtcR